MTCKSLRRCVIVLAAVCLAAPALAAAGPLSQSAHGDRTKITKGCGSCHKGHGVSDAPMLPKEGGEMCFQCHGTSAEVAEIKSLGLLGKSVELKDLRSEMSKPYRHMERVKGGHTPVETLPEIDPASQRHVDCMDCHDTHKQPSTKKTIDIRGKDRKRANFRNLTYEYELCYRCHSKSKNLPQYETDKQDEFNPSNESYHPVEAPGKPAGPVPSLIPPYTVTTAVSCSDCHGNDNALGPAGPHGSTYESMLVKNFTRADGGPETPFAYELCYSCHKRESILSNESFAYHSRHIVDQKTSCFTCHDSHGSKKNPFLVRFNKDGRYTQVLPVKSGKMTYTYRPGGASECYLSCHGVEHNGSAAAQSPLRRGTTQPLAPFSPRGFPGQTQPRRP